jgi:hypothetical protein
MSHLALVDIINATAEAVAETIYGGVHQTVQIAAARPVQDFILDFDLDTSFQSPVRVLLRTRSRCPLGWRLPGRRRVPGMAGRIRLRSSG